MRIASAAFLLSVPAVSVRFGVADKVLTNRCDFGLHGRYGATTLPAYTRGGNWMSFNQRRPLLWLLAAIICLATVNSAGAKRAIPEDNLAYPVLLLMGNSSGSGFFLNTPTATFLVTAKHVLFDPATNRLRSDSLELISYPREIKDVRRNVLALDLVVLKNGGNIKAHSSEDVVVIRVASVTPAPAEIGAQPNLVAPLQPNTVNGMLSFLPGVTVKETVGHFVGVSIKDGIKTFAEVLVGNDVMMFGYPTSLALIPNPKIDFQRPLLRKGIVAGEHPQQRSIILDCPSYQGDSGGPILELESEFPTQTYRVIGVMSAFVPFADTWKNEHFNYVNTTLQNSGYSVVTPMDFVLELIK